MTAELRIDRARMDLLLEALERMAGGDLDHAAPISDARDELDALAHAVNVLAGELLFRVREVQLAQAQLVQAAKLASLGQVSAGIAHELNNPLAVVRGYAEIAGDLVRAAGRGEPWDAVRAEQCLDRMDAQVERMSTIIRHVKEFSRQSAFAREKVPMNALVRKSVALIAEPLRLGRIEISEQLDEREPTVDGDPGRLEQVLVNLVANARDAIVEARGEGGGRLEVSTGVLPGGWIEVCVVDDGAGMSPEVLANLFTPFFTTKPPGRGTGLGLAISHGIVEQHGGRLSAESRAGEGTRMVVRLPSGSP